MCPLLNALGLFQQNIHGTKGRQNKKKYLVGCLSVESVSMVHCLTLKFASVGEHIENEKFYLLDHYLSNFSNYLYLITFYWCL